MELCKDTLIAALEKKCAKQPDKVAVVNSENNIEVTYAQLCQNVMATAKALLAMGLKTGDHIGIWSNNSVQWLELIFAAAKIGVVVVTFNTSFKKLELEFQLNHSDVKVLFVQKEGKNNRFIDVLVSMLGEISDDAKGNCRFSNVPLLEKIICFSQTTESFIDCYTDFLKNGKRISQEALATVAKGVTSEHVLSILYTSGTTGRPKGVMLTHFNIVNNAYAMGHAFGLIDRDVVDICLPIFHSFAFTASLMTLLYGATIALQELFSLNTILADIEAYGVTFFLGVPTMYIVMISSPTIKNFRLTSLKTAIIGGAPCPEQLAKDIELIMGIADARVGYGITECSPFCFVSHLGDTLEQRTQTVGAGHEHMEAKIVEDNRQHTENTCGELLIKGYNVMKGYYKDEAMTRMAIDAQGFFHTGDIATMDARGYITIKDRLKDMIIRGGENIYPAEVEAIIQMHAKVKAVSVVGVPNAKYGEDVFAYVISKDGSDIAQEVHQYALENMAYFKAPKRVVMAEKFPLNASGKVQKYIMREMAAND